MRCVIIGRVNKKRMSGLERVTTLWNKMLQLSPNWETCLMDDNAIKWEQLQNADLVMLGGDSSVDSLIYKKIRTITKSPILSLSLIRHSYEDRKDFTRLSKLNASCGNVYFAIWDETFKSFSKFKGTNYIALPKPILPPQLSSIPKYAERSGICLGHILKTLNKRFSGQSPYDDMNNVEKVIGALTKTFPKIDFYVYGSGSMPVKSTNIKIVNPGKKFVTEFLPSMRLFISLQTNETFYLVPLEAQGVGTPVIYRHAPQSLTPYVGFSGIKTETIDDLCFYVDKVYNSKKIWNDFSKCSIDNANNVSFKNRAMSMGLMLENFIRRNK